MKKLITSILVIIISEVSYSQPIVINEQSSGTAQTLTSVSSSSHGFFSSFAWVCGYGGTVLRTSNSGVNWINVSGNGIPANTQLINIASIDVNTAVTAGYAGANTFVYRTSNGGANWTQVFTETNGFIDAICFVDIIPSSAAGFMVGDPVGGRWSLWKTSNGGMNWDSSGLYLPQTGSEAGWSNSLYFDGRLSFGTNNSRIYYSSNFGANWTAQTTTGELNSYSVWFKSLSGGQTGFTGGGTLLKTTNHGINWTPLASSGSGDINGISGGPYIVTDDPEDYFNIFYTRSGASIYTSTNEGSNWSTLYTALTGNYRHLSSNFFGTIFWGVRDNGGITYIYIEPTGVNFISSEIPDTYTLSQNYPNPFNPVTNLEFGISDLGFVTLKIYNIYGKEVATLVNNKLSPGTYKYNFDASGLSSGTYFYRLEAGKFNETKSMILLK